jgi:hypothetical protein
LQGTHGWALFLFLKPSIPRYLENRAFSDPINNSKAPIFDLGAYREDLAESNPELARWFERLTDDDRKEFLKQLKMTEAVAYGILWSMGHLAEDP